MYLKDVEVQHDWFADHSILIARFHPLGKPTFAAFVENTLLQLIGPC